MRGGGRFALWIALILALVPASAYAIIVADEESEKQFAQFKKKIRIEAPSDVAIRQALEGDYHVWGLNADFGGRGYFGIKCLTKFMPAFNVFPEKKIWPALEEYNITIIMMPDFPYEPTCEVTDKDTTVEIRQRIIKRLGITEDEYETRREKQKKKLALFYAAATGNLDFIENHPGSLDVKDITGHTPLDWALSNKQLHAFKLLLQKGADPNADKNFFLKTMHISKDAYPALFRHPLDPFTKENSAYVDALLESKIDLDLQKALFHAAQAQSLSLVQKIIEHGADVRINDPLSATLQYQRASKVTEDIVNYLLSKGARPEDANLFLCNAMQRKLYKIAGFFIDYKIKISGHTQPNPIECLKKANHAYDEVRRITEQLKEIGAIPPPDEPLKAKELLE